MGLVTPEADVPTEGDADYAGDFVGIYVEPGFDEFGSVYVATGDAAFTADFGLGTVEGGVFGISLDGTNLDGDADFIADAGDILFDDVTIDIEGKAEIGGICCISFSIFPSAFAGNVVPGEGGFMDFDEASKGTVFGFFYGPNNVVLNGPEEVGVVLTLENADGSGDFISGVIGANVID
jgi:hypothetical protein